MAWTNITRTFLSQHFFFPSKAYFCLLIWFTRWGSRREWERASMSAIYLWATWAITRLGVNITSVGRTWDETSSKMSWAGINLIKENSWIHNVFRGPYHAPRGTMSNCREPLQEIKRKLVESEWNRRGDYSTSLLCEPSAMSNLRFVSIACKHSSRRARFTDIIGDGSLTHIRVNPERESFGIT